MGYYDPAFNSIHGMQINTLPIFQSKGLRAHLMKQRHFKSLRYLDRIPDILNKPDYIGCTEKEGSVSVEFVKVFEENILLAIRLDEEKQSFYVATMYDLSLRNLQRFVHSGRLKKVVDNDPQKS